MTKIITLLCVITLFSCGKSTNNGKETKTENKKESTPDKKIPGSEIEHTVITAGKHMEWLFGNAYTPWTPADEDIQYALKRIDTCFYDQKRGTANRLLDMKPEDYRMQFVGVKNSNGERLLWVNCFCRHKVNNFPNWEESIVEVDDGGRCYFNVLFNIDKKEEPYKLRVNGDA
jgi:hypothetical protein